MKTWSNIGLIALALSLAAAAPAHKNPVKPAAKPAKQVMKTAQPGTFPPIQIPQSTVVPNELDPNSGGASQATIADAATFAWQEFIALNWPALPLTPGGPKRELADTNKYIGQDSPGQPVVWETMRSKVESFPGTGNPPGYVNNPQADYGYDTLPTYNYASAVNACPSETSTDTPWVNLDETSQIGLDQMYAGTLNAVDQSGLNAQPQLIRFLAKGNRTFYDYVAANNYWNHGGNYDTAKQNFQTAAAANTYPPAGPTIALPPPAPAGTTLPNGTILVKAAWRVLGQNDNASTFHTKKVRFYENVGTIANPTICYREQIWGLIGLHIIQKTPSAPYFIFATFEYGANLLAPGSNGGPPVAVEDNNGNLNPNPPANPTTPPLGYFDQNGTYYDPTFPNGTTTKAQPNPAPYPNPPPAVYDTTQQPPNPPNFCMVGTSTTPAQNPALYYLNLPLPSQGLNEPPIAAPTSGGQQNLTQGICVNRRYFTIPSQIVAANQAAHTAIASVAGGGGVWGNYKLVDVQWQPFNLGDIDTTGANTARQAATFYQANSVIETNNTLQQFFGELTLTGLKTAFDSPTTAAYNIYLPPSGSVPSNQFTRYDMGGCMGCHGRAETVGDDFSFTLRGGPVASPETPSTADQQRLKRLREALTGKKL